MKLNVVAFLTTNAFTIQNVPIKFGFFLNSSAVVTVFTIQNVPIKLEDFYIEEESEDYLQYKMFLLNRFGCWSSILSRKFTIQNVPIKFNSYNSSISLF